MRACNLAFPYEKGTGERVFPWARRDDLKRIVTTVYDIIRVGCLRLQEPERRALYPPVMHFRIVWMGCKASGHLFHGYADDVNFV